MRTSRRARHDNTAFLERGPLRKIGDQILTAEEQIHRAFALSLLSVHRGGEEEILGTLDQSACDEARAYGRECVEAFGKSPLRHISGEGWVSLELP